ncbi:MAG: trehalose-phosphatase [Actinomycetota bacterium]
MRGETLDILFSRSRSSGVFLDFDGTLSEIAPVPEAAVAIPGAAGILSRLAERFKVVAVVSGRQISEIERRLGRPSGVRFFGLYGAESARMVSSEPASRTVEAILPRVMEIASGVEGSLVEPKGPGVALHYRLSPDPNIARTTLLEDLTPLARSVDMKLIEGKRVVELLPPTTPTKGDVVRREGAGLEAILYAGDDLADLEAFSAVDRLVEEGARSMKVAIRSAETPAALLEAADLIVEGPLGLLELLGSLSG